MSRLAPDLFQRRYRHLVEIGRSRLPSLAPTWTDHNAHDPGITLIELLAWVGEAQLYALSRTRRDERRAYAALMGVEPHGARPARGLIWPDHDDPDGPAATLGRGRVIEPGQLIHLARAETPRFRAVHRQLWIPARIESLISRFDDGTTADHSMANRRGGPAFHPFGEGDGEDAVLRMSLAATGHAPLLEPGRPDDAHLVIGVRADRARGVPAIAGLDGRPSSPLGVVLDAGGDRIPLRIVEDSTQGLLSTGVLVLDLAGIDAAPMSAVLEIRAPAGFDRSPRLLRIEPNVVPIIQRVEVSERHMSDGLPDQGFDLDMPGLEFEPGSDPVRIQIEKESGFETWTMTDRLAECGPDDRRFALDPVAARITFGNGINGAIPPASVLIAVTYSVCDGKAGNLASNRKWTVPGFTGLFGVNPDPTAGGEEPSGWLDQRREARIAVREGHALVSAADFEEAARALPGLEVGRAWTMPPSAGDAASGSIRLIVMRARCGSGEPRTAPETPRWLAAVRKRLESRTPLGSRFRVVAPTYVDLSIRARVEAEPQKDPAEVRLAVLDELTRRFTLVSTTPGIPQRPFGLPVTRRDATAWIQALPQVRRVEELAIVLSDGRPVDDVPVPRTGLPRFDRDGSEIFVLRSAGGEP